MITDGQARRIASEWHGGQASALYSFASSGHIDGDGELIQEIAGDIVEAGTDDNLVRELTALADYVAAAGPRGGQAGWSSLWD